MRLVCHVSRAQAERLARGYTPSAEDLVLLEAPCPREELDAGPASRIVVRLRPNGPDPAVAEPAFTTDFGPEFANIQPFACDYRVFLARNDFVAIVAGLCVEGKEHVVREVLFVTPMQASNDRRLVLRDIRHVPPEDLRLSWTGDRETFLRALEDAIVAHDRASTAPHAIDPGDIQGEPMSFAHGLDEVSFYLLIRAAAAIRLTADATRCDFVVYSAVDARERPRVVPYSMIEPDLYDALRAIATVCRPTGYKAHLPADSRGLRSKIGRHGIKIAFQDIRSPATALERAALVSEADRILDDIVAKSDPDEAGHIRTFFG